MDITFWLGILILVIFFLYIGIGVGIALEHIEISENQNGERLPLKEKVSYICMMALYWLPMLNSKD